MFWEAWNGDVEVVAMVFLDMSNEINPVDKATFDGLPDVFAGWWITSESENIATSMLFGGLDKESTIHSRATIESSKDLPQELCQSFRAAYWYTSDACMSRDQSSLGKT